MRLLDRYIARECLKILCLCLAVFVGVYVIVDLFEKFSKFLEARVEPALIVRYYLFSLPNFFLQVLPVGVLLASLLTLGGLARHNEVLAMKMGHVSTLRIALPCIAVGLIASLAAWMAAEYLAPRTSERALNIWRTQVRRLPAHRITRDSDIWYRAQGNRFVHISLIETQSGLIRGISLFELSPDFAMLDQLPKGLSSTRVVRQPGHQSVDVVQVESRRNRQAGLGVVGSGIGGDEEAVLL